MIRGFLERYTVRRKAKRPETIHKQPKAPLDEALGGGPSGTRLSSRARALAPPPTLWWKGEVLPPPSTSHRALPCLLLFLLLIWPFSAHAERARIPGTDARAHHHVELLTVGPGNDLFTLWGHSTLCLSDAEMPEGVCYDFGVTRENNPLALARGTLRGEPLFISIQRDREKFIEFYAVRDLWRQELLLSAEEYRALRAELEAASDPPLHYAYRPFTDNCSIRLRDALDRSTRGRLRENSQTPDGPSFRRYAEEGLSGQVLPLAGLALALGSSADERTSPWSRAFLPLGLRDLIEARFDSTPEVLATRFDTPLPTSPSAGRILLLLSGLLWSASFFWAARRKRQGRPRALSVLTALAGFTLGGSALLVLFLSRCALPEFTGNFVLLLVPVTDLLLIGGLHRLLEPYLRLRVASSLALCTASLIGWLPQELGAVSFWVLLLLGSLLYVIQGGAARKTPPTASEPTAS